MLIISLITLYKIAISSTRVQNLMISVCALCLFSFWIPQIVRNVIRGSKRGLSLWFVLGMSITRLALPVYFYACPENLLGHETTRWIWGLVLWVALQVSVLLLQDWLGPRFFIPKKVTENTKYVRKHYELLLPRANGSKKNLTLVFFFHRDLLTVPSTDIRLPSDLADSG